MATLLSLPAELRSEIWRLVYQPEIKYVREIKEAHKFTRTRSELKRSRQFPPPQLPYEGFTIDDIKTCYSGASSLDDLCSVSKRCTAATCPKGVTSSIMFPTLCRFLRREIEHALWTYCTFVFGNYGVLRDFIRQRTRHGLPLCRRLGLLDTVWLHAPVGRVPNWKDRQGISEQIRRDRFILKQLGDLCGGDGGDGGGERKGNGEGKGPLRIPFTHLYVDIWQRYIFPRTTGSSSTTTGTPDWTDPSAQAVIRDAVASLSAAIEVSGRILVTYGTGFGTLSGSPGCRISDEGNALAVFDSQRKELASWSAGGSKTTKTVFQDYLI